MTWLLVSSMCIVFGPAHTECRTQSRVQPSKAECARMIKPTKAYLETQAQITSANVVYLFVGCKSGHVS